MKPIRGPIIGYEPNSVDPTQGVGYGEPKGSGQDIRAVHPPRSFLKEVSAMKNSFLYTILVLFFLATIAFGGTTGKIDGTVTDSRTGEKLPAVNVIVEGTKLGASTNTDGYFVILNVPPGTYRLRASLIGYAPQTVIDVRVNIDQTTTINFTLTEAAITAEEVIIVARRPVVEKDVAASRANITSSEVEVLPVSQLSTVIGLQAGIQGLTIRGGGPNQTAFIVNSLTLRDERDNTPYTGISLIAVQDIQIQTGGFNAEYGNVRSGVINVVTKEGGTSSYNFGAIIRYSNPSKKYFGIPPNHFNSYWIRPFVDEDVCWTGTTSGAWDSWTQRQYRPFEGWNSISQKLLADADPTNDLTPEAARRVFLWQHRKSFAIKKPDYTVDVGFGGPVPVISNPLGKLRFYASFRSLVTQYAIPLSRDGVTDYSGHIKLTSDIARGMKLIIDGLIGINKAVDRNQTGVYGSFGSPESIASLMNRVSFIDTRLFATDYWAPNSVVRSSIGGKLTHVLSPSTFYEVSFQRFHSAYSTNPGRLRDTSRTVKFGDNYYLDEAPYGFFPNPGNYSATGINGLRMAIGMSNARDSSKLTRYGVRFDIVSQVDRYNQLKGGLEFIYVDNNVNYGSVDVVLPSGRSTSKWRTFPKRFSAYLQDKLEFEGMIANVGLRFDLSHAGGQWYVYDRYTKVFKGARSLGIDTLLEKKPTKKIVSLSPRLGVAFPVTENAKLYFNYGHFRSMPDPEDLFLVRRETVSKDIIRLADPNLPLPKTVAYELGYEHNLFNQFLFRVAAYYKDVSNQSRLVNYIGYDNVPNYFVTTNTSYEDIRGFEFELRRNRGNWFRGFLNYTYMVSTSGGFGRPRYYQNPVLQREDERTNPVQFKPIPRPYARADIDLFTPRNFGPEFLGIKLLEDIRVNVLATWFSGFHFTWVGGGSFPGVENNIQWRDSYGCDVRIAKNFGFKRMNIQLFMDINNVFNLKQMTNYGFVDGADYDAYMKSLHLPEEFNRFGYGNIPGNDRPGDYRKRGEFQPMVSVRSKEDLRSIDITKKSNLRPFYYISDTREYYYYNTATSSWQPVEADRLKKVLDDKAYIDMPNQEWFNFLNPRDIFFGLRISFDVF